MFSAKRALQIHVGLTKGKEGHENELYTLVWYQEQSSKSEILKLLPEYYYPNILSSKRKQFQTFQ